MKNSIFETLAAITYPYGALPELPTTEGFRECENCGCYTDRTGCRAVSNCCGAYRQDESDLCPRCKEHCEFECEEGGCDE